MIEPPYRVRCPDCLWELIVRRTEAKSLQNRSPCPHCGRGVAASPKVTA